MKKQELNCEHFLFFFLFLSILSLITLYLYYPSGVYLSGSDGLFHYHRLLSVHDAVCEGRYPYFVDLDCLNGYGYAANLFYPDLFLLPFSLLTGWLGAVTTFKTMLFCSFLSCGLVSWLTVHKLLKNAFCATLFALLYTFSWYRLLDMSVRSAIGELWSFTFIPLVVWGVYEMVRGDYARKWYILVIGMVGLLYCHLISALLTVVVLTVFLLLFFRSFVTELKRLKYLFIAGLMSLLLSAGFVFPLLEQLQSNTFYFEANPPMQFDKGLNPVGRFFAGLERHGLIGDSTASVGAALTFVFLLAIILLFAYRVLRKNSDKLVRLADLSMLAALVLVAVMSDIFPWTVFPFEQLCRIIQFPWRLLVFVSFFFSFGISIYLYVWGRFIKKICRCTPRNDKAIQNIASCRAKSGHLICSQLNRFLHSLRSVDMTKNSIFWTNFLFYLLLSLFLILQMKSSASSFQQGVYKSAYVKMLYIDENAIVEHTVAGGEYIPAALPNKDYPQERSDGIAASHTGTNISQFARQKDGISFRLETNQKEVLELPLLYYKGYHAELDGKELEIGESKNGLVEIVVPQSGHINVWYGGTSIQALSVAISGLALAGLLVWFCRSMKRKK
jgi:hypothetical protein